MATDISADPATAMHSQTHPDTRRGPERAEERSVATNNEKEQRAHEHGVAGGEAGWIGVQDYPM